MRNKIRSLTLAIPAMWAVSFSVWGQAQTAVESGASGVTSLNGVTGTLSRRNALKDLTNDRAKGRESVKKAFSEAKSERPKDALAPFNLNASYVLGRAGYILRENEAGAFFLKAYVEEAKKLQSPSKLIEGYNALLMYQYEVGQFEACEKTCQEFMDLALPQTADEDGLINKAKSNVIRRMLLCQSRLGEYEKAEKVLKRISGRGGLNPLAEQDLRCRMLREAGKLEEAIAGYQKLIEQVDQDEALKKEQRDGINDELKYTMTGLYTELKQVDKAVSVLEALVEKEPNNPTYNNDLGYILADNSRDLEKAEKLIRKALEEDKKRRQKAADEADPDEKDKDDEETAELDNASYLDSLGWVLYRAKRYDEAQKALESAVAVEAGRNTEIYDHLGDVLAAKGDKVGAIKYYQLGLETVSASKRDQMKKAQIEEKLKALR
jgi:tetratricopeptide (TPR) repeat protein